MAGEVNVRNFEQMVVGLRLEANKIAAEISSAYLKRAEVIKENERLIKIFQEQEKELARFDVKKKEKQVQLDRVNTTLGEVKLAVIGFQINKKDLLKELNRLNRKILEAKDEDVQVEQRLKVLKDIVPKEELLRKNKESLLKEIEELERKKGETSRETERLLAERRSELISLNADIEKTKVEIAHFETLAEYARNEKKKVDDECIAKIHDLIEYEARIKEVWDQVFPGRNMIVFKKFIK